MRARIACAMCALLAGVATSFATTRLTPAEIQTMFFNGQPFTAATPSNVKFKMTFMADGKVAREPVEKTGGSKGEGTWKLDENGFCTTWKGSKASKVSCFTVVTSGDNKWSVMRGTALMAVWTK
jgi:hypothetical protein